MTGNGDILVVEDARDILTMLTVMLTAEGYVVRPAETGESALEAVAAKVPELILLDVRMPGINGFEVLSRLKAKSESSTVPVIFLSAISGTAERVEGLKLGAVDFISKPFERAELLAKVRTHIGRYKLRISLERRALQLSQERDWLAASELKYRTLMEASFDLIYLIDRDETVQYANQAALKHLRRKASEVIGRPHASLFPPQVSIQQKQSLDLVFSNGLPQFIELRTDFGEVVNYQETHLVPIKTPAGAVKSILFISRDITGRKRAEEATKKEQTLTNAVIDSIPGTFYMLDDNGRYVRWNAYHRDKIVGKPEDHIAGISVIDAVHPDDRVLIQSKIKNVLKNGADEIVEVRLLLRGGPAFRWFLLTGRQMVIDGRPYLVGIGVDITARKKLQERFVHSQKMDSVGRLAGGVVHDFNNILLAIQGYAEFLQKSLPTRDPKQADVGGILTAVNRAAALTRHLSAFSRSQVLSPRIMDLNAILVETNIMLRRLIGEDIRLTINPSPVPCAVKVDSGQIEQVIMNLAVNARDAMPTGGTLTMEIGLISPDRAFFDAHPSLPRGPLACMTVGDTGHGMTADVRSRIFEPFFTTKEKGKGVGLGLSTAYGIIKQSGGEIDVESAPGAGAVFRIYLPCAEGAIMADDTVESTEQSLGGRETILVVDDDELALSLTARFLSECGYTVLTAAGGQDALKLLEGRDRVVDLLLTDVVMPEMNGHELAKEASRRKLAARTLFMSGYTDEIITRHSVLEPGLALINKPFSHDELKKKLREVLDGPAYKSKA
ncbi:MAG: hypothetical protein A2270_02190 [Elusimicrobia bacterium RIFOXYA12_FULL_51_18]|nr:MAG: hypothetical protein A2270_02190 [Elusimicrobia bacterium RIFOXYA12_FULL_51_18]OGS28654.1 MAG: hypothetical protein A2218_07555 [Elusimicrobia bacterium RIFOXYA2_FULL_53_38]